MVTAGLKIKRHFSTVAAFGNSVLFFWDGKSCQMISACIFMTANETRDLM